MSDGEIWPTLSYCLMKSWGPKNKTSSRKEKSQILKIGSWTQNWHFLARSVIIFIPTVRAEHVTIKEGIVGITS